MTPANILWSINWAWLNTVLDVLIPLALYAIPLALFYFLLHRRDLQTKRALEEKNEELRKTNEKYDMLVEQSAVGFFEWSDVNNPNGLYWSNRIFQMFGLPRASHKPTSEHFFEMVHPEDREALDYMLKPDSDEVEFKIIDFRAKINDEYRWFRTHRKVTYDEVGAPQSMIGSVENIHESRLAEQKLVYVNQSLDQEVKRRTQELEAAIEAKSRFLANMSHEIRTPLGLILGFSDLLGDDPTLSTTARDYLQLIVKNGEILSRVVNDLLDLSKVEAGKLRLSFTHVRLHYVLEEVCSAFEEKARRKGLDFEFVHNFPPDVELVTDEIRLKQIMYNLITNAIKFTDKGKIHIQCGISKDDNRFFFFDVIDTGLGISSDDRDGVFLEFVQGSSAHNVSEYGTGLGLRLARSLSQSLGGNVSLVNSQVNGGSHFRLTFSSQDQRSYGLVQRTEMPFKNKIPALGYDVRVLDDNEDNVRLAELFLKKLGCRVKGYTNPYLFISDTLENPCDLVLLDINMPEMSGFEVFQTLRTKGYTRPIWALTAHALNDDIQMILNHGFNAYILKPINLLTLRQKIVSEFSEVHYG